MAYTGGGASAAAASQARAGGAAAGQLRLASASRPGTALPSSRASAVASAPTPTADPPSQQMLGGSPGYRGAPAEGGRNRRGSSPPPPRTQGWGPANAAPASGMGRPSGGSVKTLGGALAEGSGGYRGGAGSSGKAPDRDDYDDDDDGEGKVSDEAREMMSSFMGHGSGAPPGRATLTSANSWAMPAQSGGASGTRAGAHGGRGSIDSGQQRRHMQPDIRGVSEWETAEEEDIDQ